ncbi:MAG: chemotaxis response regulator protein-glutamate methylesterase [Gammaproteobacteria bacterium]|nr:MAG: chemotaxis response regulator protein-glutamate methylesterase [Gammaproteobacteria bacterium]
MANIRVLIIDDSAVIRHVVREILQRDEDITIVGEAEDPLVARDLIKQLNPDVLTLDVEMPKMDGITFLANLMRLRPMPVVMLSTLTTKGADTTLQALELGAVDFIGKPTEQELLNSQDGFAQTLVDKVKQAVKIDQKNFQLSSAIHQSSDHKTLNFTGCARQNHLIAIGASTGGNDAIKNILLPLPENAPAIVITQHIPKIFSERFAQRLNADCAMQVQEARHGQKIKLGNAYIAPGDMHLKVVEKSGNLFCLLEDSALVNRHKPSVDVLFESLLPIAGNVQAVLLTGMGRDGAQGMLSLKNSGARTLIQDESSSLVWGMPGAASKLNAQLLDLPLNKMAKNLLKFASLDRTQMKGALND